MSRFMMLVIPSEHTSEGPSPELVAQMMKYNEELLQAGALLALDGLTPPDEAARVQFEDVGRSTVVDGPFAETKELVGGYWIIQARDREEAVEWARRAPMGPGQIIEVRRIAEMEDFSEEVQAVAGISAEPPEQTTSTL
jgi:hypothetical protein